MLHSFHPSIARWFAESFSEPTEVQLASWPVIAAGHHALITAPTGSGKTLTAFMWALSELATEAESRSAQTTAKKTGGRTKVLYISPLKALNNDIQRNLTEPLKTLQNSYDFPQLRVETRSGDTSQNVRQRLLRNPPDILITTPESLGLMLTSVKGRMALGDIDTVILDEVHSVVGNRRGVALMANLERLADLCGGFQRIALSATVNPLDEVAAYVAGFDEQGLPRPMQIIDTPGNKNIQFSVRFPEAAKRAADEGKKIWEPLSDGFRDLIEANQSTLFFTNSRRLAEKITLKINSDQPGPIAYAHHGSLAKDVRTEVEHRLKGGELKAIVATNSLEMGIDIGHLDEVVMVQSPPSVASALQRIGRAGHQVGETSVGTLYPTHAQDFLEAAVLADAVAEKNIEPQELMFGALDVLAQFVISATATDPWPVDDLYVLLKRAAPYAKLERSHFDLVIEMLTGRYAGSRIRELKPRLLHDKLNNTVQATKGALLALYNSGGTIPDRGYFQMRHKDTGAVLGELDEEFVWEAVVGDNLTLGSQQWQIHRITHNDVLVRPAKPSSGAPPFWRSEFFNRSFHFSRQITEYLSVAEEHLAAHQSSELLANLTNNKGFEENAAVELVDYLKRQREHTGCALPHRRHLLLEKVKTGPAGYRGPDDPQQLVIHTFWGGQLNHPWALALRAAWQAKYQQKLDIHADNNAIVMQVKGELSPSEILSLVQPDNLLTHLRAGLESSGFFGARFRECAGRSLLLTKQKFNQRLPLWMSRMQAKKLMGQVKALAEFPVLLETWRTCLDDEFNLPGLLGLLHELADGELTWTYVDTNSPSPFAHNLTFGQVSRYMYADDTPEDELESQLSGDLIHAALHNDALRPRLEPEVVRDFVSKRQRHEPGYAPETQDEWAEWIKERILLPRGDYPIGEDLPPQVHEISIDQRTWLAHIELLHVLSTTGLIQVDANLSVPAVPDARDAITLAWEILSFYGPSTKEEIAQILPVVPDELTLHDEHFVTGTLLLDDEQTYWCDTENFEILLRFQRASRRTTFEPAPIHALPSFWANHHRLHAPANEQNLLWALECLRGFSAHPQIWCDDLLSSRIQPGAYHTPPTESGQSASIPMPNQMPRWNTLLTEFGLAWRGTGKTLITVAYPEELALFGSDAPAPALAKAFGDPKASYSYDQIVDTSGRSSRELNDDWWQAVWDGQLVSTELTHLFEASQRDFSLDQQHTRVSSRRRLPRPSKNWAGQWHLMSSDANETIETDALTALEEDKERVRLLLDRYGFINRDVVQREQWRTHKGPWRWRQAFRALRVMELAGEVLTGCFFESLATPQFITPSAYTALTQQAGSVDSFWVNAHDPVSPCGLGSAVREAWPELPHRRANNYLSFHDNKLALIVQGGGQHLTYLVEPDCTAIKEINGPLHHLVAHRRQHVVISTINDEPARQSPYLDVLREQFELYSDHRDVTLQPGF